MEVGMPVEQRNVESFFQVGTVVMLHTDPNRKDGPRFKTVVRGWRKPTHLIVDRPKTEAGMFAALTEGQNCVVRFLHEGRACAFDTMIIDWDTRRSHPYLRSTWPKSLQYVSFRRFERVKVKLPCTVQRKDGSSSAEELRDLSIGGCGVAAFRPLREGESVSLSFELPDGMTLADVKAGVRNVRPMGDTFFLGLEFHKGQESVENDLAFFVLSMLDRMHATGEASRQSPRLLIIDDDAEGAGKIRHGFERKNWEALVAYDTADGLSRLRMSSPSAVVVNQNLKDLPGTTVCKVLKMSRDFGSVPVFVYGGDDPNAGAAVTEAGGDGFFPASTTMVPDMVVDIPRLLKKRAG